MNIFPRIGFLRRLWNRDADLAMIDRGITAAADIEDPGERLMKYDALAKQSRKLITGDRDSLELPGLMSAAGAAAAAITAIATLNLPLAAFAAAWFWGTIAVYREIGADAAIEAKNRYTLCKDIRDKYINDADPKIFATSPQFGKVMSAFPELRRKFVLAAARDEIFQDAARQKALQDTAPARKVETLGP